MDITFIDIFLWGLYGYAVQHKPNSTLIVHMVLCTCICLNCREICLLDTSRLPFAAPGIKKTFEVALLCGVVKMSVWFQVIIELSVRSIEISKDVIDILLRQNHRDLVLVHSTSMASDATAEILYRICLHQDGYTSVRFV